MQNWMRGGMYTGMRRFRSERGNPGRTREDLFGIVCRLKPRDPLAVRLPERGKGREIERDSDYITDTSKQKKRIEIDG